MKQRCLLLNFTVCTPIMLKKGWSYSIIDSNPTEIGGFKEVIFEIEGKWAYSRLKFESGAHRVQRVPTTESSGEYIHYRNCGSSA